MISASLEIDGNRYSIEVLNVRKIDAVRTAITARAQATLAKGRSCVVVAGERVIPCVVFNTTPIGDASVVELRCLEDSSFLTAR